MRFLYSILILFTMQAAGQRAYCVSNNGSNSAAGTRAAPYLTWAKAFSMAGSGDSILFNAGETYYFGDVYVAPGKDNIYHGRYGTGPDPVWTGSQTIATESLTSEGSGWWAYANSSLPAFLNIVTLNGRPQKMARWPATGWRTITSHSGTSYIVDTSLHNLAKDYTGWEVVLRLINWSNGRAKVTKHSGDTLFIQTAASQKALAYSIQDKWGYYLQNGKTDDPSFGDWWYDAVAKTVHLYYGAAAPAAQELKIAFLAKAANLSATGFTLQNVRVTGFNQWGLIKGSPAYNGAILDCEMDNIGEAPVYLVDQRGWRFIGNNFHDNPSIHIKGLNSGTAGCNGWTITNNTFKNAGIYDGMGYGGDPMFSAFHVGGDSTVITDNIIDSCGYNGIHTQGSGLRILRNTVTNTNFHLVDGAGIYNFGKRDALPVNPPLSIIRGNTVYNAVGTRAGWATASGFDTTNKNGMAGGIYLDENSSNFLVDSNNIRQVSWAGIVLNGTHDVTMRANNIFKAWRGLMIADFASNASLAANNNRFVRNTVSLDTFSNGFAPAPMNCFVDFHNLQQRAPATVLYSDSNTLRCFAAPGSTLFYRQYVAAFQALDFAGWKSYTGGDANSTLVQTSSHLYLSNPTAAAQPQGLSGVWRLADGSTVSGSVVVPAYGSLILWDGVAGGGSGTWKAVLRGGKVPLRGGKAGGRVLQ